MAGGQRDTNVDTVRQKITHLVLVPSGVGERGVILAREHNLRAALAVQHGLTTGWRGAPQRRRRRDTERACMFGVRKVGGSDTICEDSDHLRRVSALVRGAHEEETYHTRLDDIPKRRDVALEHGIPREARREAGGGQWRSLAATSERTANLKTEKTSRRVETR
jgi:hypothetical protein